MLIYKVIYQSPFAPSPLKAAYGAYKHNNKRLKIAAALTSKAAM